MTKKPKEVLSKETRRLAHILFLLFLVSSIATIGDHPYQNATALIAVVALFLASLTYGASEK